MLRGICTDFLHNVTAAMEETHARHQNGFAVEYMNSGTYNNLLGIREKNTMHIRDSEFE